MYSVILIWARIFLRLFFRRTIVYGREHIPAHGPLILASNHPSAFMEASILATLMGRQLHFLVRGDVFHPKFRWLFKWTNQIPIYRQKDGISNLRKNASSFDLTYQRLAEGNAVIIFPEAKTVLEKKMRPIQRGTAHLAFGTIPLIKDGQSLPVLPVGVNFIDPRIAGTDVVVRFGKPFNTALATRDDREAIESFTRQLSDAMSPLIIQIEDSKRERLYDVVASIFLKMKAKNKSADEIHDQLNALAEKINLAEEKDPWLREIAIYIVMLKKAKLTDGQFFPSWIVQSKLTLLLCLIPKIIWWIAGGWLWRVLRGFIFSKIRTNTFQGPTSVGAAMVVFPLLALIFVLISWLAGWSMWWILGWLLILSLGKLIPPPIGLLTKLILIPKEVHAELRRRVKSL